MNQIGLKFFIMAYQSQFDNTPTLASLATEQLQKTISICKDIAYRIELDRNMKNAENENMTYCFKWEDLPGKDVTRLLYYLESEFGQAYFARKIERSQNNKVLSFSTSTEEDIVAGKITVRDDYKNAVMTFDDDPDQLEKRSFVVMKDTNGTYLCKRPKKENIEQILERTR